MIAPFDPPPIINERNIVTGSYMHVSSDIGGLLSRITQNRNGLIVPQTCPFVAAFNCFTGYYGVAKMINFNPCMVEYMRSQCHLIGCQYQHAGVIVTFNEMELRFDIIATSMGMVHRIRDRFDMVLKGKLRHEDGILLPREIMGTSILSQSDVTFTMGNEIYIQLPRGHVALAIDNIFEESVIPYLVKYAINFQCSEDRTYALVRPFSSKVMIHCLPYRQNFDEQYFRKLIRERITLNKNYSYVIVQFTPHKSTFVRISGVNEELVDSATVVVRNTLYELIGDVRCHDASRKGPTELNEDRVLKDVDGFDYGEDEPTDKPTEAADMRTNSAILELKGAESSSNDAAKPVESTHVNESSNYNVEGEDLYGDLMADIDDYEEGMYIEDDHFLD